MPCHPHPGAPTGDFTSAASGIVAEESTTALLYVEGEECSELLAAGLAQLGMATATVRNPLDAIVQLQATVESGRSIFVSLQNTNNPASEFLHFLSEEHADVQTTVVACHDDGDGVVFVWGQLASQTSNNLPASAPWGGDRFPFTGWRLRIVASQNTLSCELH